MHVSPAERSEPGDSVYATPCNGLEEVGGISTEMQVTPAERSEPGDSIHETPCDGIGEFVAIT